KSPALLSCKAGLFCELWAGVYSTGPRSLVAGPVITLPNGSKREPWQGQSQELSTSFQCTTHPKCVHTAEHWCRTPSWSQYTATLLIPLRMILPVPGVTSIGSFTSPGVTKSLN